MADTAGFTTDQYTFINETIGNATAGPYADVGTGFVLASAYMVFFMHCGFAMVGRISCDVTQNLQSLLRFRSFVEIAIPL